MKAIELAKLLLENPDYEVGISVELYGNQYFEPALFEDVGHTEKVIVLGFDWPRENTQERGPKNLANQKERKRDSRKQRIKS